MRVLCKKKKRRKVGKNGTHAARPATFANEVAKHAAQRRVSSLGKLHDSSTTRGSSSWSASLVPPVGIGWRAPSTTPTTGEDVREVTNWGDSVGDAIQPLRCPTLRVRRYFYFYSPTSGRGASPISPSCSAMSPEPVPGVLPLIGARRRRRRHGDSMGAAAWPRLDTQPGTLRFHRDSRNDPAGSTDRGYPESRIDDRWKCGSWLCNPVDVISRSYTVLAAWFADMSRPTHLRLVIFLDNAHGWEITDPLISWWNR